MLTAIIKCYGQHSPQEMIKYSSCLVLIECMTIKLSDEAENIHNLKKNVLNACL